MQAKFRLGTPLSEPEEPHSAWTRFSSLIPRDTTDTCRPRRASRCGRPALGTFAFYRLILAFMSFSVVSDPSPSLYKYRVGDHRTRAQSILYRKLSSPPRVYHIWSSTFSKVRNYLEKHKIKTEII